MITIHSKPIREWLMEMDEPERSRAIRHRVRLPAGYEVESLSKAIAVAFIWAMTEEGDDYWRVIHEKYKPY